MLKVFVSSTYKDLIEHRTAVREVLHRMKTDVDAMEYFGSRPDTPESACSKEIADCDVLIGIYAWRYGWQPTPDGPSITEQEFDCAVQAGKKCLCYMVDPAWPWPPGFIDTGDAAARLQQLKSKVGKLVVSTFKTPDDLAKCVAADLANLLRTSVPASPLGLNWESVSPEIRRQVMAILNSLPDIKPAGADADRTRFVARPEYFGCLVYDRMRADYIPFDQDATDIFRLVGRKSLSQVAELLESRIRGASLQTFVQLCQSIGLTDSESKFTGVFLDGVSPPQGRLSAPTRVHFSCTNACNFRCNHCFSSSGNPLVGELTTPEIARFIDELADMGCLELSLGGGEPLMRADLPEIIRKANHRGVSIRISTNAVAATTEIVETLQDVRIAEFKVSMEGASDSVYDAVRGEAGAFRAALQGIENLRTLNVPFYLHRVFMKPNASELVDLVALATKLAADKLVLETVMPVGRAAAHPELLLTQEETNRLWEEAAAFETQIPLKAPHKVPFITPFFKVGCECGNLTCHIDPRGNVSPTGFVRDKITAGNLRRQSFREIWNTAEAFTQFRSFCPDSRCLARALTQSLV